MGAFAPPRFLPLPSPEEASRHTYSAQERAIVEMNRARHFVGTPEKVASLIRNIAADTQADEVMVTSVTYGRSERFRCYELVAHALAAGASDVNRERR